MASMASNSGAKMSVTKFSTNLGELPLFLFRSAPKPVMTRPPVPTCQKKIQNLSAPQDKSSKFVCRRPHESRPSTYSLMCDPRVRRGSYLMEVGTADEFPEYPYFEMIKKDPLCKLYLKGLKKNTTPKKLAASSKILTKKIRSRPPSEFGGATEGNFSVLCQTDPYVETLGIDDIKKEQASQTEPTVDSDARKTGFAKQRAVKTGDDKETQLEPGELWDFDEAIAPIVENLGGAVMEQALLELMQEEELDKLRDQQRVFEVVKEAEMGRLQRLQERQQNIVEQNAREVEEQAKMVDHAIEVGGQISVAMFVKNYLSTVLPKTMDAVRKDGFLKDDSKDQEEDQEEDPVVQWMESETNQLLSQQIISRAILDDIIRASLIVQVSGNELGNINDTESNTDDNDGADEIDSDFDNEAEVDDDDADVDNDTDVDSDANPDYEADGDTDNVSDSVA